MGYKTSTWPSNEIESLRQQLAAIPDIRVQEAALVGENMILKSQLAECERDNAEFKLQWSRAGAESIRKSMELSGLQEQLAECQKDAARYRWLRSYTVHPTAVDRSICYAKTNDQIDAAIDSAMGEQHGKDCACYIQKDARSRGWEVLEIYRPDC